MVGIAELLSFVPQRLQWVLVGVGAFVVASRVLSYVRLVLELFILSGTNVSHTWLNYTDRLPSDILLCDSSENMAPKAPGP